MKIRLAGLLLAGFALLVVTLSLGASQKAQAVSASQLPTQKLRTAPSQDCTSTSSIGSNFNGTRIKSGNYIWFNAAFKISGVGSGPVTINISKSSIQFTANGTPYDLAVPNAVIMISGANAAAQTTYDPGTDTWITSLPLSWSGNAFLDGLAFQVPVNLPGGINPVTWTANFTVDTPGININWQWGAAVYKTFSDDYNALGVRAVDSGGRHAGTPDNFRSYVVGGARGGGGSNFTGSYSPTGHITPCVSSETNTPAPPTNTPTRTRTRTPTNTRTPASATNTPTPICMDTITEMGSITSDDPVAAARPVRDTIIATCDTPKPYPGTSSPSPFHYDAYTYANTSGAPVCITVHLDDTGCTSDRQLLAVLYFEAFDPSNPLVNYGGDSGGGHPTQDFSVTVPDGETFVVVVFEADSGVGCVSYTMTVSGLSCEVPTNTPTRTATPAATYTFTRTPTPNRTPTRTATPSTCGPCFLYIADTDLSCNSDGTVHWRAVVRNNGPCTVTDTWNVQLQVRSNWGQGNTVQTQSGTSDFDPEDTTLEGDFCYDTTNYDQIQILFHLDAGGGQCDPDLTSGWYDSCPDVPTCYLRVK